MVRDVCQHVYGIDLVDLQQILELVEPPLLRDLELIADFIQVGPGTLTDSVAFRIGVTLIDGNELCAESQTDDCNFYLVSHFLLPFNPFP